MSLERSKAQSTTVTPPAEASPSCALPMNIPEGLWTTAIRHLESLKDSIYWLVADRNWNVVAASQGFQREVLALAQPRARSFLDTLSPMLVSQVRSRDREGILDGSHVELVHSIQSGTRSVAYSFYRVDDGWFLVGRDQTRQLDLVAQMSALLEDLELTVQKERGEAEQLRSQLSNDPLTGLPNRRHFQERLTAAWNSFIAGGRDFAVISVDIDHFKLVNDRFGHAVGDEVLIRVSRCLSSTVRTADSVARYGGEEFLVLAMDADSAAAERIAERLRKRVEMTPMPGGVGTVTVSLGVAATRPHRPNEVSELLTQSDLALYLAKTNGRNRVEAAAGESRAPDEQGSVQ